MAFINTIYPKQNLLNFNNLPLLLIISLERISWWILIIQFPIYLTQKGINGLNWEQIHKGYLYSVWAILQNISPIFLAFIIDKIGKGTSIKISLSFIFLSYLLLSYFGNGYLISIAIFIFAVFSGSLKVSTLSLYSKINSKNISKYHWAFYVFIINFSIFFIGTPLAFYLKSISWSAVFLGSAFCILVAYFISYLLNSDTKIVENEGITTQKVNISTEIDNLKSILKNKNYVIPIIAMSSFYIIYMIFYEYLPNYIFDWINTNDLITQFGVSDKLQIETSLGQQISYEWFYNLNTGSIILLIFPITFIIHKFKTNTISALILGLILITFGIYLCFAFNIGLALSVGILIYTLGEMICNLFLLKWAEENSTPNNEAKYFGFLNIASTIGYVIASISGSIYFKQIAEKSSIIKANNFNYKLTNLQITNELWDKFLPYTYIYPFIIIGIISVIVLVVVRMKKNNFNVKSFL
jgi:MFS family permease